MEIENKKSTKKLISHNKIQRCCRRGCHPQLMTIMKYP